MRERTERRMEVARPRLLLGFKERTLLAEAEARRRRDLTTSYNFV